MAVTLSKPTLTTVQMIFMDLREQDRQEIYNLRSHESDYQMGFEAYHSILNHGRGCISWVDGKPAVLGAFTRMHDGVWEVWLCGTDKFVDGLKPVMRWIRTEAQDIMKTEKVHRLQCDSRADYYEAHKLIRALGGEPESVQRKLGKDGSDYVRFVWIVGENDKFLKPGFVRAA